MKTLLVVAMLAVGCSGADPEAPPGGGGSGSGSGSGSGNPGTIGGGTFSPIPTGRTFNVCAGGGYTSIGAAVAAAPSGSLIEVCAGSYRENVVIDGKSLHLRGAGVGTTILDAGGAGSALVVRNSAGVSMVGFTVRGGAGVVGGGGILCEQSPLDLADVVLADNAAVSGAGLYADACTLATRRMRFEKNRAEQRGGGALVSASSGVLEESELIGNQAREGGGIAVLGGTLVVRKNTLSGNVGGHAGGALFHASAAAVEDNRVMDNQAGWTGGGMYFADHAPTVARNTVSGNRCENDGGGIYVHQGDVVLLDNVVTRNWSGDDGGGIRIFTSRARLERNRVEDNEAVDGGGGIRISHLPSLLVNNVIHRNKASIGGGLDLDNDSSVVRGGVVSDNNASAGAGIAVMLWPWRDGLIEDVKLVGNRSNRGTIYLRDNFQHVTLRRLTLVDNNSRRGGALYATATHFAMTHSVIDGNAASVEGGAIYLGANEPWAGLPGAAEGECPCPPTAPEVTLGFLVVHDNRAPAGSAVWTSAPPGATLQNSILLANPAPTVTVAPKPGSTAPAWRYNNTMPASFTGMANPTGQSGNMSGDPSFVNPTAGDFHLAPASACRDAGDPTLLDADGTRADLGAYGGAP